MTMIKKLTELKLTCWSTIFLGLKNGWVNQQDIIDYAISLLEAGNNDGDIAVIATGQYLSDNEFFDLVSIQPKKEDTNTDLDKWRLAHLLCITESDNSEQEKVDKLQEVYSQFNYPADMASCSIYAQDGVAPIKAMMQVVKELQEKLSLQQEL